MTSIIFIHPDNTYNKIFQYLNSYNKFQNVIYINDMHFNHNKIIVPTPNQYDFSLNVGNQDINISFIVENNLNTNYVFNFPYKITISSEHLDIFLQFIDTNTITQNSNLTLNQNNVYIRYNNIWESKLTNLKSFNTIYLPLNFKNNIINIIQKFIDDKDTYLKYEQPYKLNIMLYGLPGTGKTSISYAIANEFSKNVYFVNLFDFSSDEDFINSLKNIKDSIIVIEDIDCCFHNKKPNDVKRNHISMTCILNLLDGFYTTPGNITVITANDITDIDESFIRPLRIDHQFEFTFLDSTQTKEILNKYIPNNPDIEAITNIIVEKQLTPAYLIKFLFDNRNIDNILEKLM